MGSSNPPEFRWRIPESRTKRRLVVMSVVVLLALGTWGGVSHLAAVRNARSELGVRVANIERSLGIDPRLTQDNPAFVAERVEPIAGSEVAERVENLVRTVQGVPTGESLPPVVRSQVDDALELYYGRKDRARNLAVARAACGVIYLAGMAMLLRSTRALNAFGRVRLEHGVLSVRAPRWAWIGPVIVRRIRYDRIWRLIVWRGVPHKGERRPELIVHFRWGSVLLRSHLEGFEELVTELAERAGLEEKHSNWLMRDFGPASSGEVE